MHEILLLCHDKSSSPIFYECLSSHYHLIDLGDGQPLPASYDLCIIDEPMFGLYQAQLVAQREFEHPFVVPILLVTARNQEVDFSSGIAVSDLICEPINCTELRLRVQHLLNLRKMSIDLEINQSTLHAFDKAIESSQTGINIIDAQGRAIFVNHAFQTIFGYGRSEISSKVLPDALFAQVDDVKEVLASVHVNGSWQGELWLKHKTGRLVPTYLHLDQIEDYGNDRTQMIAVYTDVTNHKKTEKMEREQAILAQTMRDTLASLTDDANLSDVLDVLLTNIGNLVPYDFANAVLTENGVAHVISSKGYITSFSNSLVIDDVANLKWMEDNKRTLIISDTDQNPDWNIPFELSTLHSYAGVPIQLAGDVIGFINLGSKKLDCFTPIHAERLQAFAELAAIAIQNAKLYQKAQHLATLQERQRLARDLHDAVTQTLFSASLIAEALPRLWQRSPDKVWSRLVQLQTLTRGAMAEMRSLLVELRPEALLTSDMEELLEQLVDGAAGRSNVAISLNVNIAAKLPPEHHEALYYITIEAINNIIKHTRAKTAQIVMTYNGHKGRLSIEDDGRGFDRLKIEGGNSFGLEIMHERASSIDAHLEIISEIGNGTKIIVSWDDNSRIQHE